MDGEALVLLAALVLGDVVTRSKKTKISCMHAIELRGQVGDIVHVLGEAIEVFALLLELLAESEELLPLTLTDGHVLAGLLAALPGVTKDRRKLRSA